MARKTKTIAMPNTKSRDWSLSKHGGKGTYTEARSSADAKKVIKSTPGARIANSQDRKAIKSSGKTFQAKSQKRGQKLSRSGK